MLAALTVRDIVLIEQAALEFAPGLNVLTGETGAGKSILLDSLGLAVGGRGRAGVRPGAAQGSATAVFDPAAKHGARALLKDQAMPHDGEIVLRRSLAADGKSRAFINDEAVSVGLLKDLGGLLLEVHGQADDRGLFDNATFVDCTLTYANGIPMRIRSRTDGVADGNIRFHGEKGWIDVSRTRLAVSSEQLLRERLPATAKRVHFSKNHHTNFFDSIRGATTPVSDLATGHRTNTVCILADIAMRMQSRLQWDPAAESFVGNDRANRLLGRAMRGPWSLA